MVFLSLGMYDEYYIPFVHLKICSIKIYSFWKFDFVEK